MWAASWAAGIERSVTRNRPGTGGSALGWTIHSTPNLLDRISPKGDPSADVHDHQDDLFFAPRHGGASSGSTASSLNTRAHTGVRRVN
jgi:hypothetical protein